MAGLLVVIGLLQPRDPVEPVAHGAPGRGRRADRRRGGLPAGTDLTDAFNEMAELILDFPISSTEVLYIFLPALLFEAALGDGRRSAHARGCRTEYFLLAVIAVLVTTAVVGLALWPLAGMSLPGLPAAGGHHRRRRSGRGGRHLRGVGRASGRCGGLSSLFLLSSTRRRIAHGCDQSGQQLEPTAVASLENTDVSPFCSPSNNHPPFFLDVGPRDLGRHAVRPEREGE